MRGLLIGFAIFVIGATASAETDAAKYCLVGGANFPDGTARTITYAAEPTDAPDAPGKRRIWYWMYQSKKLKNEIAGAVMVALDEFDCREKTWRSLSVAIYDRDKKLVSKRDAEATPNWKYVTPDTLQHSLLEFTCDGGRRDVPLPLGVTTSEHAAFMFSLEAAQPN